MEGLTTIQSNVGSAGDTFMQSCFSCHEKIKERDLVFTRYAP
jgi:hypothetical protein